MKKLLAIILAIALCMAITVYAYADEYHPARLVDDADLLTQQEEEYLTQKLDEISTRQNFDVAILTTDYFEGKYPEEFADDYFDYNGYGMGEDYDGILLVLNMTERTWVISTHAFGIVAFTDAGQDYIADLVIPYIVDGDYAEGFDEFASLCDNFVTQAKTGTPYDVYNMPGDDVDDSYEDAEEEYVRGPMDYILSFLGCLGFGAVGAGILRANKKSQLKTVRTRDDAADYWTDFTLTEEKDIFLHRNIVAVKIKDDDDNKKSGGSRVRRSSSGRVHGGSSRKF